MRKNPVGFLKQFLGWTIWAEKLFLCSSALFPQKSVRLVYLRTYTTQPIAPPLALVKPETVIAWHLLLFLRIEGWLLG